MYYLNRVSIIIVLFLSFSLAIDLKYGSVGSGQWKCVHDAYPPKNTHQVSTWKVNLDEPAHERWKDISIFYSKRIKDMLTNVKEYVWQIGIPGHILTDLIDVFLWKLVDTLPSPYGEELRGISKYGNLSLSEIVLYNIFYELTTLGWCVSLVAQDMNGEIYHARNLDFGLHRDRNRHKSITDVSKALLINVDFVKGGKVIFKSTHFAGYIGVVTGVRPKAFSLSVNTRFDPGEDGLLGVIEWIMGKRTGKWTGFLTRETMLHARDYQQALKMLTEAKLLAPVYFIMGGNKPGEGCVITRAQNKTLDVWKLSSKSGGWFIVESNYDHWKPAPRGDHRRNVTDMCLLKMTQKGVSKSGVFNVLSTRPVCDQVTTSTSVMKVNTGSLETWKQYCID